MASLISNKINYIISLTKRDREEFNIIINGKIHQDDISILNNYALNPRATESENEALLQLKLHFDLHSLILGDISTPLSSIDKTKH